MAKRKIVPYSDKEESDLAKIVNNYKGADRIVLLEEFCKANKRTLVAVQAKIQHMRTNNKIPVPNVQHTTTAVLPVKMPKSGIIKIDIKQIVIKGNEMLIHY